MNIKDSNHLEPNITFILCVSLAVVFFVNVLFRRWKYKKVYKFMASIPGPIAFPVIGSIYIAVGVTSKNVWNLVNGVMQKYPGWCAIWIGNDPYIVVSDREIFNAILSSSQNIDKFRHYYYFKAISPGIFSSEGAEWRTMRKIINPSFRTNVLTTFGEGLLHHTSTFLNGLEKHANGENFDIFLPVHLCTIDFIFDNMMNSRMDVQKQNATFLSVNAMTTAEMIFERAFSPLLWPDIVYSLIGKQKVFDFLLSEEQDFTREVLYQRLRNRKKLNDGSPPADNLQRFIEILLKNVDSGTITADRAAIEVFEIYVAGSMTTAMTASWIFKMLAMFPEIQEKAYQEILDNCDRKKVTIDDLSKLIYVEMIVKETLRHFTVPVTGRKITEDLKVNEKLTIPAGIEVFLCPYALHHDPQYWQKPFEFHPEHFSPTNEANRPKGAFAPFSSGPRVCPGYKYAMQSVKFLVANTLLHYMISTDEKPLKDIRELDYRLIFMIYPMTGFRVKVKRRSSEIQTPID